jgi:hypothetical protein
MYTVHLSVTRTSCERKYRWKNTQLYKHAVHRKTNNYNNRTRAAVMFICFFFFYDTLVENVRGVDEI